MGQAKDKGSEVIAENNMYVMMAFVQPKCCRLEIGFIRVICMKEREEGDGGLIRMGREVSKHKPNAKTNR